MFPLVGAAADARLSHQDEAGEQDCLKGNDGGQQGEWSGVEMATSGRDVQPDPGGEDRHMSADEFQAARTARDQVAQPFRSCTPLEKLLLMLCDQINVLLDRILRHRGSLSGWMKMGEAALVLQGQFQNFSSWKSNRESRCARRSGEIGAYWEPRSDPLPMPSNLGAISRRRNALLTLLALSLAANLLVVIGVFTLLIKRGGLPYLRERIHPTGGAVFFGDSMTNLGDWTDEFHTEVANFGVRGNETKDVLARTRAVIDRRPDFVFLMVGTNDALRGRDLDTAVKAFDQTVAQLRQALPHAIIYVETVLPITDRVPTPNPMVLGRVAEVNGWINRFNQQIAPLADNHAVFLINLHDDFLRDGQLVPEYTVDGIHLNARGYWVWRGDTLPLIHH